MQFVGTCNLLPNRLFSYNVLLNATVVRMTLQTALYYAYSVFMTVLFLVYLGLT